MKCKIAHGCFLLIALVCLALPSAVCADQLVAWGNMALPAQPLNQLSQVVAGGGMSLALRSAGSIVGWGNNDYLQAQPRAGNDYIAIDAGGSWGPLGCHGLALKSDGSIVGWGGYNDSGRLTPAGNDYVAITAGNYHSLALKSDGSIVGWGSDRSGQATPPAGADYIAIAAGSTHSLALKSDGSIVAWGRNNYGQATPPAGNGSTD